MKEIDTMICEHVYNSILFVNEYLNTNGPAITITIALCKEARNEINSVFVVIYRKKYLNMLDFMSLYLFYWYKPH